MRAFKRDYESAYESLREHKKVRERKELFRELFSAPKHSWFVVLVFSVKYQYTLRLKNLWSSTINDKNNI